MLFSSLTFLFTFLPIVIGLYFLVPKRSHKNLVLFLASILFYAWGEPVYIILILISTVNDYTFARLVEHSRENGQDRRAKLFFILSLVVNLSLLGYFKYSAFFAESLNHWLSLNIPVTQLPLPIGISFYTFQTMSYSIDVYLGNVKAQKRFLPMATYVALFPQLIAGPIVRYITIEKELEEREESIGLVADGLRRFIIGLGKKVIIANQMGLIADTLLGSTEQLGTALTWFAIICYSFQIYFDFSGYSDMAIGLGRVFGFHFLENFNYPYVSRSITEFWRRWHISLGTWFKDYVYIPLGGNRTYAVRNLFIVWLLTGLWHGASWNYVLWGLYYGLLLAIEKYILKGYLERMPKVFAHFYALFFIVIGWAIFRLEDGQQLMFVLRTMFVYSSTDISVLMYSFQDMLYAVPVMLLAIVGSTPLVRNMGQKVESSTYTGIKVLKDASVLATLLISIGFLVGETFNPFIYFRF